MNHSSFFPFFRLFSNYEEIEGEDSKEGLDIYTEYLEAFKHLNCDPPEQLSKYVHIAFPSVTQKRSTNANSREKRSRVYFGLQRITEVSKSPHSWSEISAALPVIPHVNNVTYNDLEVIFEIETDWVLDNGHPAIFIVSVQRNLSVSCKLDSTLIALPEFGISDKLVELTIESVHSVVCSLRCLTFCNGVRLQQSGKRKKCTCHDINDTEDNLHVHAGKCRRVLLRLNPKSLHVCRSCSNGFPGQQKIKSESNELPKATSKVQTPLVDAPLPSTSTSTNKEIHVVTLNTNQCTQEKKYNITTVNVNDLSCHLLEEDTYMNEDSEPAPENIPASQMEFSVNDESEELHTDINPGADAYDTCKSPAPSIPSYNLPCPSPHTPVPQHPLSKDAAVGTTPLKSAKDFLVKFYPPLSERENLLHLLSEQIELAQISHPSGRRYDKVILSLSITLWIRNPKCYETMLKAGFILPCPGTLSLYKNCISQKAGFNQEMFRWMYKESITLKLPAIGYIGGLLLDEMNVAKDMQITTKGGEWRLVGMPDMGEGSNAMSAMTANKGGFQVADHMLQFLFHGMTGFRMPFACFPTLQANSNDIQGLVWKSVYKLRSWQFIVKYICLDGSQNNRSFIKSAFHDSSPEAAGMVLKDRSDPSNEVAVLPDPSHVKKKLRSSAKNSGNTDKHTRHMIKNDKYIEWKHWEDTYEWCQDRDINPLNPHPKLTHQAIYLSEADKMRNKYADEALNETMLCVMQDYQRYLASHKGKEEAEALDESIEFLKHTQVLIKNFDDPRPISDMSDPRLVENRKVLKWFQDWVGSKDLENDPAKRKEIPSVACMEDLTWLVIGFESLVRIMLKENIPVIPCDTNSDVIENYFCSQRAAGGCKTNPTVQDFLRNSNSIILGTSLVSTKSNAGIKQKNAEPYCYNQPGPVRPKKSKKSKKD